MSFQRYPAYRDSGVEWLGEVPAHWEVVPLKYLVRFQGGGTPSKEREDYWDGDIPWISAKDMKSQTIINTVDHLNEGAFTDGVAHILEPFAVIVVVRGMILARTFPVCVNLIPMAINQDLKALISGRRIVPDFCAWYLRGTADESLRRLDEAGHGTKALRMDAWSSLEVALPPLSEQSAIATFLDRETARIDALVTEQEKLIDLLKEKRQAVISRAVTKGLDPQVPMKDSGIAWLGEVPAHWEVVQIRRISSAVYTGSTPSLMSGDDAEEGVDWVTPGDFDDSIRLSGASKKITVDDIEGNGMRVFPPGSVFMVGIGATIGKVGVISIAASANQQINIIIPERQIVSPFLAYFISSQNREIRMISNISTIGIINQNKTKEIWILLPPVGEQEEIVHYIEECDNDYRKLETEAQKAITLLKERRAALISAAVTGRIDVRDRVAAGVTEAA